MYIQGISEGRNALAYVSRLPTEVLAAIFGQLRPIIVLAQPPFPATSSVSPAPEDYSTLIRNATHDLISVSHVCRRWREVALENSDLWSTLWLENRTWMTEMLFRSRDTPLTLIPLPKVLPGSFKLGINNMDVVLPSLFETRQARQLFFHLEPCGNAYEMIGECELEKLCAPLRRKAPRLEKLQIQFYGIYYPHDAQTQLSVIDDLCGGYAPSLRELSILGLRQHGMLWKSPILSNLVTLTVSSFQLPGPYLRSSQTVSESLEDLLCALQQMTRLERLYLDMGPYPEFRDRSTYHRTQDVIVSMGDINLPRLSKLVLRGHLEELAGLTSRLQLPLTANVSYTVGLHEEALGNIFTEDIVHLRCPIAGIVATDIVQISLALTYELRLRLRCLSEGDSDSENTLNPIPNGYRAPYCITFCSTPPHLSPPFGSLFSGEAPPIWVRAVEQLANIVGVLSSFPPLDNPRELQWITTKPTSYDFATIPTNAVRSDACAIVLRGFSSVQRLVVDSVWEWKSVFAALASDGDLLPQLTRICLRDWVFSSGDGPDPSAPRNFDTTDCVIFHRPQTRDLMASLRGVVVGRRSDPHWALEILDPVGFNDELEYEIRDIVPELVVFMA